MAFADKKGIKVASGFKLQSGPLDVRASVATLAERNEYVTINAAYPGMIVYVEADKTLYVYNTDKTWTEVAAADAPTVGTLTDEEINEICK